MTWVTIGTLLFVLASPALAGPTRCQTYYEQTLNRYHTICADGTRGLSTYNRTLGRWDTTISPLPGKPACTGTMNPRTQQLDVRCRQAVPIQGVLIPEPTPLAEDVEAAP